MASNHPDSAWVVIFCDKTNRYCLGKRTDGLYDFFGGGVGCTESPRAAAIRELKEEASIGPDHPATKKFEPILKHKFGENTFYYFLMVVSEEFRPVVNDEHEGSVWLREDQIPYDLHLSTRIYFGKLWSRFMNAHKVYGKKVTASANSDWLHYLLRILGAFAVEAEPKDEWIQNSISRKYQITQTMLDGLWKKDPSKYCLALSKILIDDVIPDVTLDHAVSKGIGQFILDATAKKLTIDF
jgi:8-oxo-dGTP pyrophosphatase MutT (NUDIX family)